jgi:hypothetical protein
MPERFARSTEVQSLVFSKEYFTRAQAKEWAEKHGFKYGKVDETDNTYRLRQTDPDNYDKDTFRYKTFKQGIRAVVAMPLENPNGSIFSVGSKVRLVDVTPHHPIAMRLVYPRQVGTVTDIVYDEEGWTVYVLWPGDDELGIGDKEHGFTSTFDRGEPVDTGAIELVPPEDYEVNPRSDEGWTAELFLMIAHEDNEVYLDSVVLGGRRGKWKTPRGQKIVGFGDKQVMRVSFARAHGDTKEEAEEHLLKFQPRWIIDVISD